MYLGNERSVITFPLTSIEGQSQSNTNCQSVWPLRVCHPHSPITTLALFTDEYRHLTWHSLARHARPVLHTARRDGWAVERLLPGALHIAIGPGWAGFRGSAAVQPRPLARALAGGVGLAADVAVPLLLAEPAVCSNNILIRT
jgi:hypothetical protein